MFANCLKVIQGLVLVRKYAILIALKLKVIIVPGRCTYLLQHAVQTALLRHDYASIARCFIRSALSTTLRSDTGADCYVIVFRLQEKCYG